MTASYVSFLDPYGNPDKGVDHLGMRVAGEAAYSRFIDFITTVSWRPRYFSFLCWALQQAWEASAEQQKDGFIKVNKSLQQSILKKLDYLVAASTLALYNESQRIAGSEAIVKLLKTDESFFKVRKDHLRSSKGSYDIYVGSMRALGLVETAGNVDRPSESGKNLAKFYKNSLGTAEKFLMSSVINQGTVSLNELISIGKNASLSALNKPSIEDPLKIELLALRKLLFGPSAQVGRRLSSGLILRAHLLINGSVNLDQFRSLTLINGLRTNEKIIPFQLPLKYQCILPQWATYQAHALVTYSLESLLAIALDRAKVLESHKGEGVAINELLNLIANEMASDNRAIFDLPEKMKLWWNLKVSSVKSFLLQRVEQNLEADFTEIDLYTSLKSGAPSVKLSFLLYIFSVVRLEAVIIKHGPKAWSGSQDPFRLPPNVLIDDFQEAAVKDLTIVQYARHIILNFVIKQHHQNAMRKLAAIPKLDTSKFSWEGDRLVPIGSHRPGTSNPRFSNAVFCLTDLGYLSKDGKVTSEGNLLLKDIERE
jgi:hypothetical protein